MPLNSSKKKLRLEAKIKRIRGILAYEKRKFGGYDDSRGLRYLPTEYFVKLQDYKGGMVYTRWFEKSDKFQSISDRYIKAQIRLKTETDPEMRHLLVRIDRQLLKEV